MPNDCCSPSTAAYTVSMVLFVAILVLAAPAIAQDVSEEELESFEGHVETAVTLLADDDYKPAIEEFDQAREIIDHPRLSVAIAEAYLDWQRCSRAEDEFRQLQGRDDLDDDQLDAVDTGLGEATDDCIEHARLDVECSPPNASLRLEDRTVDCPYTEDVAVGDFEFEAIADGHESQFETITVDRGEINRVAIELSPKVADDPDSSIDWLPIATWSTVGIGSALLIGGGVSDYRAGRRTTLAARAHDEGDDDRVAELEAEADSARTRTMVLYGLGGGLLVAGLTAHFIDVESLLAGDTEGSADYSLRVGPTAISTVVRW